MTVFIHEASNEFKLNPNTNEDGELINWLCRAEKVAPKYVCKPCPGELCCIQVPDTKSSHDASTGHYTVYDDEPRDLPFYSSCIHCNALQCIVVTRRFPEPNKRENQRLLERGF